MLDMKIYSDNRGDDYGVKRAATVDPSSNPHKPCFSLDSMHMVYTLKYLPTNLR